MKEYTNLESIATFPTDVRQILANYGITTAESFFDHVLNNMDGVCQALGCDKEKVRQLQGIVEKHVAVPLAEATKRPRGLIVSIPKNFTIGMDNGMWYAYVRVGDKTIVSVPPQPNQSREEVIQLLADKMAELITKQAKLLLG